jgi:exonuclease 3'-5' domain-containing protein 1
MASSLDDEFQGHRLGDDSGLVEPCLWLTFRKVFIDTEEGLADLLTDILSLRQKEARLYIDLEGDNLCRHGTISVLQIYISQYDKAYLVDVHTLGKKTFEISVNSPGSAKAATLRDVFEDVTYTKVLFDLRNDSDALFGLYRVRLRGVQDVQLMACHTLGAHRLPGLQRCIRKDAGLDAKTREDWENTKTYGKRCFLGGDYSQFAVRPMDEWLQNYCANDVRWLPQLRQKYWQPLSAYEKKMVIFETEFRVKQSQAAVYQKHGALGPEWRWGEYGHPEYPLLRQSGDQPDWPDCYCGRYQGLRHHCEEQCSCYEVCCKWWVDREPPSEGKPAGGPKYSEEWGYDIPRLDLMDRMLPWDPQIGGSFHNTPRGRHLEKVVAELKRTRTAAAAPEESTVPGDGASRPYAQSRRTTPLCCDPVRCARGLHTELCYSRQGVRLRRSTTDEYRDSMLWTDEPPKENAWENSRRIKKLRSA